MKKIDKIRKVFFNLVLGERSKDDNILITKEEKEKIKDHINDSLKWDNFNIDHYTKILNFRNS
jgi:CRISPR/Cas system-associated protein Cas7 (RAMP superfamily)|tara:strand:+ start:11 stop:199 length:189 start_codon:yes stop_codon:yes gene_type:complete